MQRKRDWGVLLPEAEVEKGDERDARKEGFLMNRPPLDRQAMDRHDGARARVWS